MNAPAHLEDLSAHALGETLPSPAASSLEIHVSPQPLKRPLEHSDRILAMMRKYPDSGLIFFDAAGPLAEVEPS